MKTVLFMKAALHNVTAERFDLSFQLVHPLLIRMELIARRDAHDLEGVENVPVNGPGISCLVRIALAMVSVKRLLVMSSFRVADLRI